MEGQDFVGERAAGGADEAAIVADAETGIAAEAGLAAVKGGAKRGSGEQVAGSIAGFGDEERAVDSADTVLAGREDSLSNYEDDAVPGGVRIVVQCSGDEQKAVAGVVPAGETQIAVNNDGHGIGGGHHRGIAGNGELTPEDVANQRHLITGHS